MNDPEKYRGYLRLNYGPWVLICTGATRRRVLTHLRHVQPLGYPCQRLIILKGCSPTPCRTPRRAFEAV